jgi:hypothetical protein
MPFDGNGTFTPPNPEYPAVGGTVIYADDRNIIDADIADGLTNCMTRDGQSPPTADVPMGTFKITGLGDPSAAQDAVTLAYLENAFENVALQPPGTNNATAASTAFVIAEAFSAALPSQTGNAGKFIQTDGTTATWEEVLPDQTGNEGKILVTDGSTVSWEAYGTTQQIFTASGTYTPAAGMKFCIVEIVGGGAGGITASTGNFTGAGGGAGEYARGRFTAADIGASKAVTVGAGGAAGAAGSTSSLSTLLTAIGGNPGTGVYTAGLGGSGGTGTGLHVIGGDGAPGQPILPSGIGHGGQGGGSYFGGGGAGSIGGLAATINARAYGAGGGGNGYAAATFNTAGAGASGVVIITEFF